jgi:hypothetical protein
MPNTAPAVTVASATSPPISAKWLCAWICSATILFVKHFYPVFPPAGRLTTHSQRDEVKIKVNGVWQQNSSFKPEIVTFTFKTEYIEK